MACYSIQYTSVVVKAKHWNILSEGLKESPEITGVYVGSYALYGSYNGTSFSISRPKGDAENVNVEVADNGVPGLADQVKNSIKRSYSHQAIKTVVGNSRWPMRKTGANTYVATKMG